jgi:hypothetical protein
MRIGITHFNGANWHYAQLKLRLMYRFMVKNPVLLTILVNEVAKFYRFKKDSQILVK